MSLHIERISVKNLGPLGSFDATLGGLNLFYGLNEAGKTYLVEFIINALFKISKRDDYWKDLRLLDCQGKVLLKTSDGKTIEFGHPASTKRQQSLGEIIARDGLSINLPLLKTLIVRAGDVRIGQKGISKDILKDVFFSRNFYAGFYKNKGITSTIQQAIIEPDGTIRINKKGSQQKDKFTDDLKRIDALIDELQRTYDQVKLRELNQRKEFLEREISEQLRAKRHRAFVLSEEIKRLRKDLDNLADPELIEKITKDIEEYHYLKRQLLQKKTLLDNLRPELQRLKQLSKELEEQKRAKAFKAWCLHNECRRIRDALERVPEEKLQEIRLNYSKLRDLEEDYNAKLKEAEALQQRVKHLDFVRHAERQYEQFQKGARAGKLQWLTGAGFVLSVLAGVASLLKDMETLGLVLVFIGLALAGLTGLLLSRQAPLKKELEALRRRLEEISGQNIETLAEVRTLREELERENFRIQSLRLDELRSTISHLRTRIQESLRVLAGEPPAEQRWQEFIDELFEKRNRLTEELGQKERALASLNVSEDEFISDDTGIEFSPSRYKTLEEEIAGLREKKARAEALEEEISDLQARIDTMKDEIKNQLQGIFKEDIPEQHWQKSLHELKKKTQSLNDTLTEKKTELRSLNVSEDEYLPEGTETVYNPETLETLRRQLKEVEEEITEVTSIISALKGKICNETGLEISSNWDKLIEKLLYRREDFFQKLKKETIGLVTRVILAKEIQKIQKEEDQQIEAVINSSLVKDFLKKITGRYESIELDGEDFYVSDRFNTFKFESLSTGAQEAVLLALRLGMAMKLSGHDRMFIILDDAFQHVDWQKRPNLVQSLVDMARDGWQIIYLTMDDHIRDLFNKQARPLGPGYRFFDLKSLAEGQRSLF